MPSTKLQIPNPKQSNHSSHLIASDSADTPSTIAPFSSRQNSSVDDFLDTTKRVLGYAITTKGITIARDTDIDVASGKGEITVRSTLPDGTQLEARRVIQRHSIRWRRLWPYIAIILVLTTALIIGWHAETLLKLFQEITLAINA